jgi:hypothetical protein
MEKREGGSEGKREISRRRETQGRGKRRRVGGGGGKPGPPEHPEQVLYFTAPCNGLHMHALHIHVTFLFSIQRGGIIFEV